MEYVIIGRGSLKVGDVVWSMQNSISSAVLLESWRSFSRNLGINETMILDIDTRFRLGVLQFNDILREILAKWIAVRGREATLKVVYDALVNTGVRDIAESLEEQVRQCTSNNLQHAQSDPAGSSSEIVINPESNRSNQLLQSYQRSPPEERYTSLWNKYVANDLKRTFIGSTFNALVGRNTTHIRNESGQDIIAVIASLCGIISEISVNQRGNVTVETHFQRVRGTISRGLISPGETMPFERNNRVDFLTIGLKNDDGSVKITVMDVQILANNSYRVNSNGALICHLYS